MNGNQFAGDGPQHRTRYGLAAEHGPRTSGSAYGAGKEQFAVFGVDARVMGLGHGRGSTGEPTVASPEPASLVSPECSDATASSESAKIAWAQASSAPDETREDSAAPPETSRIAESSMDLPAPVSPVMAVMPAAGAMVASRIGPRLRISSSSSIRPLPCRHVRPACRARYQRRQRHRQRQRQPHTRAGNVCP